MSEIEKLKDRVAALEAVAKAIEIKGPDADMLVWAIFHGSANGYGAVSLGHPSRIISKVAMIFEQDRRAALALGDEIDAEADAIERRAERFAREA
jgi:hypothetical protein